MANIKQVYQYDQNTKEYVGKCFVQESPLEPGVWLIPSNTTEIEPPEVGQYQKQVFNAEINQWEIKPDYRNVKAYSTAPENIGQEINLELGQDLVNATLIQPPQLTKYYEELKWENGNWGSHWMQGAGNTLDNFVRHPINDELNGVPRTANETRPKNFALMYQIVRG